MISLYGYLLTRGSCKAPQCTYLFSFVIILSICNFLDRQISRLSVSNRDYIFSSSCYKVAGFRSYLICELLYFNHLVMLPTALFVSSLKLFTVTVRLCVLTRDTSSANSTIVIRYFGKVVDIQEKKKIMPYMSQSVGHFASGSVV